MPTNWAMGLAILLLLGVPGCGRDHPQEVDTPSWAQVSPEQVTAARRHGVPVAFENALGMQFVLIPAGTFLMGSADFDPVAELGTGSSDEHPRHAVTLTRPYYMQATEVTNAQFREFDPSHGSGTWGDHSLDGEGQPVVAVTWSEAHAFALHLSACDAERDYRLPTEAEWESACRASAPTPDSFADGPHVHMKYANLGAEVQYEQGRAERQQYADGFVVSAPVASFAPSPWGLYDLVGNVWEYCGDFHASRYPSGPITDPSGPSYDDAEQHRYQWTWLREEHEYRGPSRVMRGLGWKNLPVQPDPAAERGQAVPGRRSVQAGFRLVSTLPVKAE